MKSIHFFSSQSSELEHFPHIMRLEKLKNSNRLLDENDSLPLNHILFIFSTEGKFEGTLNGNSFTFLPNDLLVIRTYDVIEMAKNITYNGSFFRLCVHWENFQGSSINKSDFILIDQLVAMEQSIKIDDFKDGLPIFSLLCNELLELKLGYISRVNSGIDELVIKMTRMLNQAETKSHDFPKSFIKLDKILRDNLAHPWTVQEMAQLVNLGITTFTEKIKFYTGFSPIHYLINLRIAEAIRMMKKSEMSMTQIALETGFYSSQHFSSTFKKHTGFSPKFFRKNG